MVVHPLLPSARRRCGASLVLERPGGSNSVRPEPCPVNGSNGPSSRAGRQPSRRGDQIRRRCPVRRKLAATAAGGHASHASTTASRIDRLRGLGQRQRHRCDVVGVYARTSLVFRRGLPRSSDGGSRRRDPGRPSDEHPQEQEPHGPLGVGVEGGGIDLLGELRDVPGESSHCSLQDRPCLRSIMDRKPEGPLGVVTDGLVPVGGRLKERTLPAVEEADRPGRTLACLTRR